MGFSSEGLFSALALNALTTPLLLAIAYFCYNTISFGAIKFWKIYRPMRPVSIPSFFNFGGFPGDPKAEKSSKLRALFRLKDPWFESEQGMEARIYLTFLKLCMAMFLFIGVLTGATLIPTNYTDDYRVVIAQGDEDLRYEAGIADFTTRNLHPESDRFWVMFVISVLVAYEVYSTVLKMVQCLKLAKAHSTPPDTAVLYSLPEGTHEEVEKYVWSQIPVSLRRKVVQIELPHVAVKGMLDTIDKREAALAELEHWYAVCQKEGITGEDILTHPKIMTRAGWFSCEKTQPIVYYRQKYDEYCKTLLEMKELVNEQPLVGTAYVTFKNAGWCATFVLAHSQSRIRKLASGSDIKFAPHPRTIIWENAGASYWRLFAGNVVIIALLFFAAIVWAAFVGFLGNVDNLSEYVSAIDIIMETNEEMRGLITAYLPVIALALLHLLLPILMRALTQHVECVGDKGEREVRVLRKMTVFGLVTSVLLQAPLQGAGDSTELFDGKSISDIYQFITKLIVPTNGYFVVYVLQAAFMGNLVRFLRLGDFVLSPIMAAKAFTKRELFKAYHRRQFFFSEEYAFSLITLGFALVFAPNVPYIPIFGFFYFLVRFFVDRAVLLDIFPRSRESDFSLLPCCINCLLGIFLCMQVLSVTILSAVKEQRAVMCASLAPVIMTIVVMVYVNRRMSYFMGPAFLKDRLEGKTPKGVFHLPNVVEIFAYPEWDTTPIRSFTDEHDIAEAVVEAEASVLEASKMTGGPGSPGTPLSPDIRNLTVPDFSKNPLSAYRHTCNAFVVDWIDHDDMARKCWLYEEAEDDDTESDLGGPYPGIVSTSVFFSNPSLPSPTSLEEGECAPPGFEDDDPHNKTIAMELITCDMSVQTEAKGLLHGILTDPFAYNKVPHSGDSEEEMQ